MKDIYINVMRFCKLNRCFPEIKEINLFYFISKKFLTNFAINLGMYFS